MSYKEMIYYRIPSGRYGVEWKDSLTFGRVLKLKNEFVHSDRNIFIHNGNTPKDSNGCLLINQADNNKENTLFNSKIAKEHFTNTLQSNNSIRKYFNNIDKDEMIKQIEVRIENNFQSKIPNKITEQELPPNIIRIETQDESEEFIEIILPPTFKIDDPPLQDTSAMFVPALRGIGSVIKGVKGISKLNRSLTKEEVLEVVERLPRNPKEFRRKLVNSKKGLDELWERLTKNTKELEPKTDKRYGLPIYRRELDDGTIIQYKKASTSRGSTSGGETIEINSQNPRENLRSIHIKKG